MDDNTIGIDVSKAKLDIFFLKTKEFIQIKNNITGFNKLKRLILKSYKDNLIVVEHTDSYQKGVVKSLRGSKCKVCIANPLKVRNFARAKGYNAKTDRIDARLLAEYGFAMKPGVSIDYGEIIERLKDLVHYKINLNTMITEEKNRLEKQPCPEIYRTINKHLEYMQTQLKTIKQKIKELIVSDEYLSKKRDILLEIKGVGEETISSLLCEMPELGSLEKAQAASLSGLAPFNRDSGFYQGKQKIQKGRKQVRNSLYMAALSAKRYNPILKEFYERLRGKGKPYKVAITAVMRKLIIAINAKCKNI